MAVAAKILIANGASKNGGGGVPLPSFSFPSMPVGCIVADSTGQNWQLVISSATVDHTTTEKCAVNPALRWVNYTGGGGGGGALLIANNLSDLASVATARTNLGVQSSTAVNITGGTITGTTIALAPAQLSSGLVTVVGSTGVLGNPTLSGLTYSGTTLSNDLTTGVAGNGTVRGSTTAGSNLILAADGALGGKVIFGQSGSLPRYAQFDESNGVFTIGAGSSGPTNQLEVVSASNGNKQIRIANTTGGTAQSSNYEAQAGTANWFGQLNSHNFTGANGRRTESLSGSTGDWMYRIQQASGDFIWTTTGSNTERLRLQNAGTFKVGTAMMSANATTATVLGSVGPAGASTTVQEWFTVVNSAGTTRYIPAF